MGLLSWVSALAAILFQQPPEISVKSDAPTYVVRLPPTFVHTEPKETPRRYLHFCGRETWEKVTAVLVHGSGPLEQNPAGVTLDQILPFVTLPPDSKPLFFTVKWNNLDVGAIEYQAVEKSLPVIGLSVVLPLQGKAVTLTVSAPTPLEKEARADLNEILSRFTDARPNWYTAEDLGKIRTLDLAGKAGGALLLLYPVVWLLILRGDPMRGHWVRVAWLAATGILLFVPITSPGPTTIFNNLLVNGVLPLVVVTFLARRIKMGIDEG
jgi:hypothetical protein